MADSSRAARCSIVGGSWGLGSMRKFMTSRASPVVGPRSDESSLVSWLSAFREGSSWGARALRG